MKPIILIDSREQAPFAFSEEVDVQTATLETGDYSIAGASDRIVFERKSLEDYVACCSFDRERHMDQCRRLGKYERSAIVVEASVLDVLEHRYTSRTNPRSVIGTANAVFLDYGVPVFWLNDPQTAARAVEKMLVRFAAKETPAEQDEQGHDFVSDITRAVVSEIRAEMLLAGPARCVHDAGLPHELDAERVLIGALLAETIDVARLAPLTAADFFDPMHRAIVISLVALQSAERGRSVAHVVLGLRAQDFTGADVDLVEELVRLRAAAPSVFDLQGTIAAVFDAARRRRLALALRNIDVSLRLGSCTAAEAVARLDEVKNG